MPYKVVNSELKYNGKIIDVVQDEITLPDGRTAIREVVLRGNAAAIVPIDECGNITLVRQYRHGAGCMVLEIPAGMLDSKEELTIDCAIRELEEETGIIAGKMEKLLDMHVSVAFCTEIIEIFLATNLSLGKQNLDEDEFLELETYSMDEIIQKIMTGEIIDSKTISGIFAARELLESRNN